MKNYLYLTLFILAVAALSYTIWWNDNLFQTHSLTKATDLIGTPPRLEEEYKLQIINPNNLNPQYIQSTIKKSLFRQINQTDQWHAPKEVGTPYFLSESNNTFLFHDIYFDTKSYNNKKLGLTLRIRKRWKNITDYLKFKTTKNSGVDAIRTEIQGKKKIDIYENGLSTSLEARLEFTKHKDLDKVDHKIYLEYEPSDSLLLNVARTGKLFNKTTTIAKSMADVYQSANLENLFLSPVLNIYTQRTRYHFNIKTSFGWGNNPSEAFIVTLDRFVVRKPTDFDLNSDSIFPIDNYEKGQSQENWEIEIEFERNISTKIENTTIYNSFKKDLDLIIKNLTKDLLAANIELKPLKESKYNQGLSLLEEVQ